MIERLEKAKGEPCSLSIFPNVESYRQDLLWHANNFLHLTDKDCDRKKIQAEYRSYAQKIYDTIPESADSRTAAAAAGYSRIGIDLQ